MNIMELEVWIYCLDPWESLQFLQKGHGKKEQNLLSEKNTESIIA